MSDVATRFARLFRGRTDAFGADEGLCVRVDDRSREAWIDRFERHLRGDTPIGVYPLTPFPQTPIGPGTAWMVRWGASDLDLCSERKPSGDYDTPEAAYVAALNLQAVLDALGIVAHIERTRSGGFHVWVFAEDWVPASMMRRALLTAHQVAGVRATEVNPKSETLPEGAVGNYVRLPFPRSLNVDGVELPLQSRVMLDISKIPIPLKTWLAMAEHNLASMETLQSAADLWVQPVQEHTLSFGEIPELTRTITDKLSPRAYFVLREGPIGSEVDRSGWLYRLAAMCADDALSPEEAAAVVLEADRRHTQKYVNRRDGERWIRKTVEKAYVTK